LKYLVSLSGGKDSTATLLWILERRKKEDIVPVFADTGWEMDEVYEYLEYLENKLEINIHKVRSKYGGMKELCIHKKFMPNLVMRFCTNELKQKPLWKFMVDNFYSKGIKFFSLNGVRREESFNRSNRKFFEKKSFTYNRKRYIENIIQPIVNWSENQVFEYIKSKGLKINPLYERGFKRVGCMPCIYDNPKTLEYAGEKYIKRLRDLESAVSDILGKEAKWFSPSKDIILRTKSLFPPPDYQGG